MGRTAGRIDTNRTLAERLERLCDQWSAEHGRPLSNHTLSAALGAARHPASKPYLSQLHTENPSSPSTELLLALACFFEVELEHFFGNGAVASEEDSAIAGQLLDPGLRRLIHTAADLSAHAQGFVTRMAESFRAAEGLIEHPSDSTPRVQHVVPKS